MSDREKALEASVHSVTVEELRDCPPDTEETCSGADAPSTPREKASDGHGYELLWPGKTQARVRAGQAPTLTMTPRPKDSVRFEETKHLFLEGDNLEALKLLRTDFKERVGIIYIDPPYNTGEVRSYRDDYSLSIRQYAQGLAAEKASSAPVALNLSKAGRLHADWLSMLYPRLLLAHSLLRDDGAIFVSIDDNELHNLRILMDEIFGPENYVETFSWVRTRTPANLNRKTKKILEYVVAYQKAKDARVLQGVEKPVQSSNPILNQANRVGILTLPSGTPTGIADGLLEVGQYGTRKYTVELLSPVEVRDGRFVDEVKLKGRFRWSQQYLEEQLAAGTQVRVPTERLIPAYERQNYGPEVPPNLIDENVGVATNEQATLHVETLLGGPYCDYPKPVSLIRYLLGFRSTPDDIVLDFFAGSCTTAEAVLNMNREDGGSRQFIMVEWAHPLPRHSKAVAAGYETTADVGKERIRQVIDRLEGGSNEQLSMVDLGDEDRGFRVYELTQATDG